MSQIRLPETNENGYYEIRLESIGGLGANLCGKLLGELGAVYLGLNSASFSSYGSEKRGSPVKAFIRWCGEDEEIRINSPVENPHILGLFHEAMAGKQPVMAGVTEYTKVIVNTDSTPDEMREKLKLHAGELYCVDALKIAMEAKSRINMVTVSYTHLDVYKRQGCFPFLGQPPCHRIQTYERYPGRLGHRC